MNKWLSYKLIPVLRWLFFLSMVVCTGSLGLRAQAPGGLGSADDLGRTLFKSMQDPDFGWLRYTLGNPEVYRLASPEDTKNLSDEQVLARIRENVYPRMMQRSLELRNLLEEQDVKVQECKYLRTESFEINSAQDILRRLQVFLSYQDRPIRLETLSFEYQERWYLTEIILPEDPGELIDP